MKKILSTVLVLFMIFTIIPTDVSALTTDAKTPTGAVGLKWKLKLGQGYSYAPTPPLVIGNNLYVGAGNRIYKVDKNSGKILKTSVALGGKMGFAMMAPVVDDATNPSKLFIGIDNGKIQCLDFNSLTSKWISGTQKDGIKVGGDTNSPILYKDGFIYTGTWGNKDGQYICINASNGELKWVHNNPNGYYWAGATIKEGFLIVGSESDRQQNSAIECIDINSGELESSRAAIGNIRTSIISSDDKMYAASQAKKLYEIDMDSGQLTVTTASQDLSGVTTGDPTIHNGKIYLGTSASKVDVYELDDLSREKSLSVTGYPQGGLLITNRDDGKTLLYGSYNRPPGGMFMIDLDSDKVYPNFFKPADSQFSISPVVADQDGILYYKNDSCYLMAITNGIGAMTMGPTVKNNSYDSLKVQWPLSSNATSYQIYRSTSKSGSYKLIKSLGATSKIHIDKSLKTGTTYYYKLRAGYTGTDGKVVYGKYSSVSYGKPQLSKPSLKTKAGKKQIKVSWKKVSGASGYEVYRATKKKGKYKKVKTIKSGKTKPWTNKKLKSKKKYYYKLRAYRKVGSKKVYSVYSGISYKKVK